jgi:Cdc6-like AAA superfamily ATPase
MHGNIIKYNEEKGFGHIIGEDNKKYTFSLSDIRDRIIPRNGVLVEFQISESSNTRARHVVLLQTENESISDDRQRLLLTEITKWKLESKLENNARYFFLISDLFQLLNGEKCYVIGRKGTGKTAIAEYILQRYSFDHFATKLTFKNFPFNELYKLADNNFTYPNQYITAWKYIIYSTIARMMARNSNIDSDLRNHLVKLYPDDQIDSLPKAITRWTNAKFKISFLGSGAEIGLERKDPENDSSWIDKVNILENILYKYLDKSQYFIVFDELDEDYNSSESNKDYMALLTGLFKAAQDIKSIFGYRAFNVLPLIFIRDDIFKQIRDPDKTKWLDLSLQLTWTVHDLKQMLAFRLSRARDPFCEPLAFNEVWNEVVSAQYIPTSQGNKDVFAYISEKTFLRPRDYVQYLKCCAQVCVNLHRNKIDASIVKKVDNDFSNWFRNEMEDEIYGMLPDVEAIFNMISHIRKIIFSFQEFSDAYVQLVKQKKVTARDLHDVLDILFNFSVIGNHTRSNARIFRYLSPESRLNISEPLIVHRGLFASLQLY